MTVFMVVASPRPLPAVCFVMRCAPEPTASHQNRKGTRRESLTLTTSDLKLMLREESIEIDITVVWIHSGVHSASQADQGKEDEEKETLEHDCVYLCT